jgi:hypothetical protein
MSAAATAGAGACIERTRNTAPMAAPAAITRIISRTGDMKTLRKSPTGLKGAYPKLDTFMRALREG